MRSPNDLAADARAVLFDALGTLIALQPPARALQAELARRFELEIAEAESQRALDAEIAYYRAHLDEGRDPPSVAALRGRCAQALRAALPRSSRLACVGNDALTQALLASLRFTAFPDAAPAIAGCRARGQQIVVVSNWDVSLVDVLARLGLAPLLDAIVTSAQTGVRKPSPGIFRRALDLAAVQPEHAIHVGDSLADDVAGACAAGVKPILIRRDGLQGPPQVPTIGSLCELGERLRCPAVP